MKSSKFFVPIGLFLFMVTIQMAYAQTKVGISAGANISNANIENENGDVENTQSVPGLRIGMTFDIPVFSDFYIQPAAVYSQKGFKQNSNSFCWL